MEDGDGGPVDGVGLSDGDSGALVSAAELIDRRDRNRWELDPRSKDPQP